jgi:hypothetical protein
MDILAVSFGGFVFILGVCIGGAVGHWGAIADPCDCSHCRAHRAEEDAKRCSTCGAKLKKDK